MPRKPIKFELDFMIKDIFPRFTVKQFDDVSFNIKPLNQGLDYDTSNMIGKIFVGVNNDMFMQTTDITVSSDNINVLLDKNMLQKNGRAYAEIELTDEAGTITSSSFIFDIDPKIGEGGMIPGEYEGFVEKYERLISEFKAQINSSIDNSNNLIDKTIKNCNTSVDNKLNTVDSLVNTKITNINNTLNTKVTEVDNKLNTVDGLITAKVSDFEKRFNRLTSSQQQDAEVIEAREGEVSLKARLDKDIENPKKLYTSIEGTEISVDSLEGYLKDIEILGNTVQDQDNLADIRSVGDKLENQELYEIPVLSRGKNLFDGYLEKGSIEGSSGQNIVNENCIRSVNYIRVFSGRGYVSNLPLIVSEYDVNKKHIQTLSWNNGVYNPSSNCSFVRFRRPNGNTDLNEKIQIEEGTVSTPYEPYVEDKLTILSPVQLEKVGDVADRIICKDGVWGVEKNVKDFIIPEGTNYSIYGGAVGDTLISISMNILPNDIDTIVRTLNNSAMSDKYVVNKGNDVGGIEKVGIYLRPDLGLMYVKDLKSKYSTHSELRSSLGLSLLKYPTTQPTFIPLPYDQQVALRTFANKTNIHFECEIEPTLKASVPKSLGASVSSNTTQIDNLSKELQKINNLEETVTSEVVSESDFITVENTNSGYFSDIKLEGKTLILNADNEVVEAGTEGATLKSVGQDVDEISVLSQYANGNLFDGELECGQYDNSTGKPVSGISSVRNINMIKVKPGSIITIHNNYSYSNYLYQYDKNKNFLTFNPSVNTIKLNNDCHYINFRSSVDKQQNDLKVNYVVNYGDTALDVVRKQDKKRILYHNTETDTWEKPVLRQFDSIEKHSDNKYYYHVRSEEVPYTEGDETKADHITDMTTTVKKISTEKVYECTDLDLITYSGETNLLVKSGVLNPKVTLKVKKGIGNVVTMLQNKVAMLEDLVNKLIQK